MSTSSQMQSKIKNLRCYCLIRKIRRLARRITTKQRDAVSIKCSASSARSRHTLGSDQELIAELFDSLETVHDQLAMASGLIGRLAHTLKPNQLMLVLKASIRPLIQLRTAAGVDIEATTSRPTELP